MSCTKTFKQIFKTKTWKPRTLGEAHKAQKIDRLLINHGAERPVTILRLTAV
jgi:hypothetical protein